MGNSLIFQLVYCMQTVYSERTVNSNNFQYAKIEELLLILKYICIKNKASRCDF
jgi:hypothetical protein